MPQNLDEKVRLLLEDIKNMQDQDARARLKQFVLSEINFLEAEHVIEESDLSVIRSQASKNWVDTNFKENKIEPENERVWLLMDAFVSHFRSRGLIPFKLTLKKRK